MGLTQLEEKTHFPRVFYFQWCVPKSVLASKGPHAFQIAVTFPWFKPACYIWPGVPCERYIKDWMWKLLDGALLCLVREKVSGRDKVNEVWFEEKNLCDFSQLCLHTKEGQKGNHEHLSPCPPSISGYGWACFHQPVGMGCLWWHSPST